MKIVFFGTPEFAVIALKKLLEDNFDIVAVVTAPDKPAGRGLQLHPSEVKKFALEKNLPVLQPTNLKDNIFIEQLQSLQAELFVVVAFRMLPEVVWAMPPLGSINLHASLLPNYRGAAPINWAIIRGEKETGVTTFRLKKEIDTGDIIMQEKILIDDNEDVGSLYYRMANIGAAVLSKTILRLSEGNINYINQEDIVKNLATTKFYPAPKLTTEICKINWHNSIEDIFNLIRGLSPYPTAFCFLQDKKTKIFKATKEQAKIDETKIGNYITDGKTYLKFVATDGYISIIELQPENKKRMDIEAFLRGARMSANENLI